MTETYMFDVFIILFLYVLLISHDVPQAWSLLSSSRALSYKRSWLLTPSSALFVLDVDTMNSVGKTTSDPLSKWHEESPTECFGVVQYAYNTVCSCLTHLLLVLVKHFLMMPKLVLFASLAYSFITPKKFGSLAVVQITDEWVQWYTLCQPLGIV